MMVREEKAPRAMRGLMFAVPIGLAIWAVVAACVGACIYGLSKIAGM